MEGKYERHRARRGLFSSAVPAYEGGRPGYPESVYDLLVERCGLGPGTRVLEDLARVRFGGLVERPYLTPIYLAQRRE